MIINYTKEFNTNTEKLKLLTKDWHASSR